MLAFVLSVPALNVSKGRRAGESASSESPICNEFVRTKTIALEYAKNLQL
jgi:hypothetical protein